MSRIIYIFALGSLVMFSFFSCRFVFGDRDRDCRTIVPIETMVEILHDIYLMEGFILANADFQVEDTLNYYFAGIFQKHQISHEKFKRALDCYLFNRDDMTLIHDKIIERFSIRHLRISEQEFISRSFDTMSFRKFADCFVADVCY